MAYVKVVRLTSHPNKYKMMIIIVYNKYKADSFTNYFFYISCLFFCCCRIRNDDDIKVN